ncbi:MAG: RNA polymerase sigma factor [Mariniblastus sp.]
MDSDNTPRPENLDSSRIIERLREGGVDELSKQFMQLRPSIRTMIASRIHGKLLSRLDASDIVQETFIRASKMLQSYLANPTIHPTIWLRALSKQIMAETVRKQYRLKRSPEFEQHNFDSDHMAEVLSDSLESVGQKLQRVELVARIRDLLLQLPVTDREILEMRHTEVFSFQEIGDLLDINMEAAKKRYYRALDRFRSLAREDSVIDLKK